MNRICKQCEKEMELNSVFFSIYNRKMRDGSYKEYFRIYCRECEKLNSNNYRLNHLEYTKKYNSRPDVKARKKQWAEDNNDYQNRKEYFKKYYKVNIAKKKEYSLTVEVKKRKQFYKNKKMKNDPIFRMRQNVSNAIFKALKRSKTSKGGQSILKYIGYNIVELKLYIENQFDNNMNWNNYGSYWHIDHIIPQSCLPYTSMEEDNFKKCWALSNLRPLEAKQNIIEGSNRIRHLLYKSQGVL